MAAIPRALILGILLVVGEVLGAPAMKASTSDCDRDAIVKAADAYVEAQTAGNLDPLRDLLANNWTYVENNEETAAEKSVIATKALAIDHRRTTADTTQCATYTELISTGGPYVIGTQIRHGTDGKTIAKIDSVATTTNSWLFNARQTLEWVQKETWAPIPEDRQDSRAALQAAGDAWLDMWSDGTAADRVPFGTPCARLEGSSYTGRGAASDSCRPGIPSNHNQAPNVDRRYVIDEAAGSVDILCRFQHMMNASDNHEFRLEDGKLRYVHTMTVCPGGKPCRL